MHKTTKTIAAALAMSAMTTQAFAGGVCSHASESAALKAETLQQQLMVAALQCGMARSYNSFVISYRQDLVAADQTAQSLYQRAEGANGFTDYQAFKTRLANDYSMDSSRDTDNFCGEAQQVFDDAGQARGEPLNEFVASLDMSGSEPFAQCRTREASTDDMVDGGSSGAVRSR